jgi:phage tail sheath protein FI/limonene-1,2-epoxide hydrolase
MTSQLGTGASQISIVEEPFSTPQIAGVPTSIYAAVGVAERGPIGVPTLIVSFAEYQRIFGKDTSNGYLSHAVRGFFEEGGQQMYVVRVVHYSDVTNAASKTSAAATLELLTSSGVPTAGSVVGDNAAPFDLEPAQTLVVAVDGGSADTATFNATAAARSNGGAGPYTLSNGQTLTVSIDGGAVQTVTFLTSEFSNIAAATRAEVVAVLNAKLSGASASDTGSAVRITSDRRGTGSGVNVTGGTANTALVFTTGNVAGTGNVSNINAVTFSEVKAIVEAAVADCTVTASGSQVRISSSTTGSSSSIQVQGSSTAANELGLDFAVHTGTTGAAVATLRIDGRTDGDYAHRVRVKIANASGGAAEKFDLQVIDDGVVVNSFPDLTMDEADARYAETVMADALRGSSLVVSVDLGVVASTAARRPANGTFGPLAGGDNGLASIGDNDFIGTDAGKTGLYALDTIPEISIISVPDRATAVMQQALINYCETWRGGSIFAILDPPAGLTAAGVVDYVVSVGQLLNASEFSGMYWPRVEVRNPNTAVYGNVERVVVPNSGHVAGVYARTDARPGGIYNPPAGSEVGQFNSVLGFETDEVLDIRRRGIVFQSRINPLTSSRGIPPYIDGSRTLKGNGNFPFVGERRGVIFIEQSIKLGIEFARHRNNSPELRREVTRIIDTFLNDQMKAGAFRSKDPAKAYFVDFGDGLNPDTLVFEGKMIGRVGLATQKPAEFIEVRFSQNTQAPSEAA